jgi:transposase
MTAKRRQYTQEFKDSAVKLVTEQGCSLAEASRNLGINTTQLRRWKNALEELSTPDENGQTAADLRAELVRLKKENHRLQLEREILKKAAAFFAKESGSGIS